MNQNNYYDITFELCELSDEIISQLRAQLSYYQISAYKNETASQIESHIKSLKLVAKLLCSATLKDVFEDYAAEQRQSEDFNSIDDCALTLRVTRFIKFFEIELSLIKGNQFKKTQQRYDLRKSVRKFKHEILSICPAGSRARDFFQSV